MRHLASGRRAPGAAARRSVDLPIAFPRLGEDADAPDDQEDHHRSGDVNRGRPDPRDLFESIDLRSGIDLSTGRCRGGGGIVIVGIVSSAESGVGAEGGDTVNAGVGASVAWSGVGGAGRRCAVREGPSQ